MTKPSSEKKTEKGQGRKRPARGRRGAPPAPAPAPAEQPGLFGEAAPQPMIISRPEHCVSRKDVDREALKVLYRLKDQGYIAYLVGGSVRDLLLGRTPKDFDIGTNAKPAEIRKLFRYSRIIGKRFKLVHVYFRGGKVIEVSTFRRPSDYDDREAEREGIDEDEIFGLPQEDAFRRDLTINGLFYNIADFSVIDYVGGISDLQQGIIRFIGDSQRRVLRDPVRMLRAVRHAARTGFAIEPQSWEAIVQHKDTIRLCALSRVRDEWIKDLRSGYSRAWCEIMLQSGLFAAMFQGYAEAVEGQEQDRARSLLGALLGQLDQEILEGREVSEAFMLALFLYPALHVASGWQALQSDKLRWATYEVRALMQEMIAPYDFKRAVQDHAAQILSSQWPIEACVARNNWPKRVWSKASYPEAVQFYDFVHRALGEPVIGPDPHLRAKEGSEAPSRPKRRRRRRPRLGKTEKEGE